MQAADLLSDLTSLRACDPAAALALVSARPQAKPGPTATTTTTTASPSEGQESADADLQRARDLLRLHYEVKVAHEGGLGAEMLEARESVRRAVAGMGR